MRRTLSAKLLLAFLLSFAAPAVAFDVSGGQTGAWYDPAHDGEGYILQIINENQAVVFWFTYDKQGNQAWMIGVGDINGSKIFFPSLVAPVGGKFGPNFDPEDVERPVWGSLEFDFTSCNAAEVSYDGPAEFGSGQLSVVRLTAPWAVGCDGTQNSPPNDGVGFLNPGFTGAWFDPDHDGEGFTVEILNETTALIYWFTFNATGDPAWMVAIAEISGSQIFADEVLITSGAMFGEDFDPSDVIKNYWGQAVWSFGSCSNGGMRYIGPDNFGPESTQTLVRLTGIDEVQCAFNSSKHSVSAKMQVAGNVYLDGDTNDLDSRFIPNNGDNGYQEIFTPATVAGFVTLDPTGEPGTRMENDADEVDWYRVLLRKDEQVSLVIADYDSGAPTKIDLDLWLYDVFNTDDPADTSLSTNKQESVTAPSEGEFWVGVQAYAGSSNYALKTGFDLGVASSSINYTASAAPDEIRVQYDLDAIANPGDRKVLLKEVIGLDEETFGLKRISESSDGGVLYDLQQSYVDMYAKHEFPLSKYGFNINDPRKWMVVKAAKAMQADPAVEFAEPNYLLQNQAKPNDLLYPNQWHYRSINLEQAWDVTTGDKDVVVAIIDSGVAPHPDIVANVDYSIGFDFADDYFLSKTYDGNDGIDNDARDPGPGYTPARYLSHGTHVAGTVGAVTNNSDGLAGVNWNVTIMPLRMDLTCWSIEQSLKWAGRLPNASGTIPSRQADVINMSFGGYTPCGGVSSVLSQIRTKGIVLIAAAGNDSTSQYAYPASSPGVVSVSATNFLDELAHYSNFGSTIDISAPGGDVNQWFSPTGFRDGVWSPTGVTEPFTSVFYATTEAIDGTSMASPHVAGIAALMKSIYPELDAADFDAAITSGAITTDLARNGPSTVDAQFGYGRIDALKAVNWALDAANGMASETFITASASSLDFGPNKTGLVIDIHKSGSDDITLDTYSRRYEWITIEGVDVDNRNFGEWRIVVDRTGLARGRYRDVMTFNASNGSQVSVSLIIQVGETVKGEAGYEYGVLIDAYSWTSMQWWSGNQQNAGYAVSFSNMPPGLYYVMVGSDMDGDQYICDDGEFCQIYPSWSNPQLIEVTDASVQLRDFIMSAPEAESGASNASLQSNSKSQHELKREILQAAGSKGFRRPAIIQ